MIFMLGSKMGENHLRCFSPKIVSMILCRLKRQDPGIPPNYQIFFFIFKEARRIFRTYKKKPIPFRRPSPEGAVFVSRFAVLKADVPLPD